MAKKKERIFHFTTFETKARHYSMTESSLREFIQNTIDAVGYDEEGLYDMSRLEDYIMDEASFPPSEYWIPDMKRDSKQDYTVSFDEEGEVEDILLAIIEKNEKGV